MLLLWTILLACYDDTESVRPPLKATRIQSEDKTKPGLDAPILAAEDPASYGEQWLVILSSKEESGFVPENVDKLYNLSTAPKPVRLQSSHFKGLMPCFEIVIARSFFDWRSAQDYIESLERVGLEAYTKNAGQYVGDDPRLSHYCEAEAPTSCGDVHLVREVGEELWMALSVDEVLMSRAAVDAPPPYHMGRDFSSWGAPLTVENVGPYSKGQVWRWFNQGEDFQCAIAEFGLLTLGTPHFSYSQLDDLPDAPGCGSPELYARLTCDGGAVGAGFAVKGAAPEWVGPVEGEPSPEQSEAAKSIIEADSGLAALRETATKLADGAALNDEVTVDLYASGRRSLAMVNYRGWTGEGVDECGGSDVDVHGFSLVSLSGKPQVILPPEEGEVELRGLWYRNGALEYALHTWPDEITIYNADGEAACGLALPFCDCPC